MSTPRKAAKVEAYIGSGNVFEDIGVANPDEALAKASLAHEICELIRQSGLNQTQAARRLGIDQPKISALMRGRLSGFSMERLCRFLSALGRDVEIVIRPAASHRTGAVHVLAKAG